MTTYPEDADGQVLANMAADGVDMSQPLLIDFAIDVPNEETATTVADALRSQGYETEIEFDKGEPDVDGEIDPDNEELGPCWTVYANVTMVPNYDEIIRIQADLDRLAGPLGGQTDGWGALVG